MQDQNEFPPVFTEKNYTAQVNEDASVGNYDPFPLLYRSSRKVSPLLISNYSRKYFYFVLHECKWRSSGFCVFAGRVYVCVGGNGGSGIIGLRVNEKSTAGCIFCVASAGLTRNKTMR